MKAKLYFKNPKLVRYKTYSFGSLPDNVLLDSYLLATRGSRHLIYCAKTCFFNGELDTGSGCLIICKKSGKNYVVISKDDRKFQCWRNIDDYQNIETFVTSFLTGEREDDLEDELIFTEKNIKAVCSKLDKIELDKAKKQMKKWKAKNKAYA